MVKPSASVFTMQWNSLLLVTGKAKKLTKQTLRRSCTIARNRRMKLILRCQLNRHNGE